MQRRTIEAHYEEEKKADYKEKTITLNGIYGQEDVVKKLLDRFELKWRKTGHLDNMAFVGYSFDQASKLVKALANEMSLMLRVISFEEVEKPSEMAAILNGIKEDGVLFIRFQDINTDVLKVLTEAMEDNALWINIGKGPTAKRIRLELPRITYLFYFENGNNILSEVSEKCPELFFLHELSHDEKERAIIKYCNNHNVFIEPCCVPKLTEMFDSWIQLEKYLGYLTSFGTAKEKRITSELLCETKEYAERLNRNGASYPVTFDNQQMPVMDESEKIFDELLRVNGRSVNSGSSLRGLCKDYFYKNALAGNLIYITYDAGIIHAIEETEVFDKQFVDRYVDVLVRNYGLKQSAATWGVNIWIECYGRKILGKP